MTPPIYWIRVDALVSGATGLVLAAASPLLDGFLGIPIAVLVPLGLFLLAYAGDLVLIVRRGAPRVAVMAVIAGNTLWVVLSVVAVAADWLTLTTAGTVVVLAQAAAVLVLAELQLLSLRRAARPATA
jgi:hypothetical protein